MSVHPGETAAKPTWGEAAIQLADDRPYGALASLHDRATRDSTEEYQTQSALLAQRPPTLQQLQAERQHLGPPRIHIDLGGQDERSHRDGPPPLVVSQINSAGSIIDLLITRIQRVRLVEWHMGSARFGSRAAIRFSG